MFISFRCSMCSCEMMLLRDPRLFLAAIAAARDQSGRRSSGSDSVQRAAVGQPKKKKQQQQHKAKQQQQQHSKPTWTCTTAKSNTTKSSVSQRRYHRSPCNSPLFISSSFQPRRSRAPCARAHSLYFLPSQLAALIRCLC